MNATRSFCALLAALGLLTGCAGGQAADTAHTPAPEAPSADGVTVQVSDSGVLVDGESAGTDPDEAVYTARDIVYYESGHDFTYGEGTASDEHDAAEAEAHTVVHISQPGTYILSGSMSHGQIAVDLGEDADEDPEARVTLVLNGLDITCTVAPAVIFYNVYECDPEGDQGAAPDMTDAGAVVVIADGTENTVNGSYVARIYKSYTLSADGTSVTDSKKLHKYDGAFYSKMSMRVEGGSQGTGVLTVNAENEGLDTEMHLSIDGGTVVIRSGNDGINVNEDDLSVVTVNGGTVHVTVTGDTGEGDGIDSNGWLVINGGAVTACACSDSMDAGLDAAQDIVINGGTVIATGNMLDPVQAPEQCCAVFTFAQRQSGGQRYSLTGQDGGEVMGLTAENGFTYLLLSGPALTAGESYSLYAGQTQLQAVATAGAMGIGRGLGGGMGGRPALPAGEGQEQPPEIPEGENQGQPPEMPDGEEQGQPPEMPEGENQGQPPEIPEGEEQGQPPEMPGGEGSEPPQGGGREFPGAMGQRPEQDQMSGEATTQFTLNAGINYFGSVTAATQ